MHSSYCNFQATFGLRFFRHLGDEHFVFWNSNVVLYGNSYAQNGTGASCNYLTVNDLQGVESRAINRHSSIPTTLPLFISLPAAEKSADPTWREQDLPFSIITRGLTSSDDREISNCLKTPMRTHAGTGLIHESFDKNEPSKFKRAWFAWANTVFG